MKFIFLIIGIFSFSIDIVAQVEYVNSSTVFVPKKATMSTPNPSSVVYPNSESKKETVLLTDPNTMQFTDKNDFKNPGDEYKDKLNKNGEVDFLKNFRKNQFLGEFKTNSSHVRISYRDYDAVDGDLVSILVNDKVVFGKIFLEGDFQGVEISLEKGFNKIDFMALTEGDRSPNTAEFKVFDDKGFKISSNKWGLLTGYKATIILVKE